MARRLVWSLRARRNLRDLLDAIAQRSPANAAPVAKRFFARLASLREVVHSWRIIYRVTAEEVTVVAIVHGARLLKNVPRL